MPIYEYQCTACHHTCDILQKIHDAPITLCPHCAKDNLVKLVSAAAFQLKGTGWYVTDFKNKPTAPSAAKDTSTTTQKGSAE